MFIKHCISIKKRIKNEIDLEKFVFYLQDEAKSIYGESRHNAIRLKLKSQVVLNANLAFLLMKGGDLLQKMKRNLK